MTFIARWKFSRERGLKVAQARASAPIDVRPDHLPS
jgi:hypothetical protein